VYIRVIRGYFLLRFALLGYDYVIPTPDAKAGASLY
jgi:hypothetical protein